ncbi:MAG: sugar phosphate isomerase/epimerase family protein [Chloroflexota bacterium]
MSNASDPLRLGVSTSLAQGWLTPEELQVIEDSPVAAIELMAPAMSGATPEALARTLAALARSRLERWSLHTPFGREIDLSSLDEPVRQRGLAVVAEAMRFAAQVGCRVAVVHPSSEPIADDERAARFAQSRRSLAAVAELAAATGVRAALEPLPRTCLGNTLEEVDGLLADLPAYWLGICLDVNHINVREDVVAAIYHLRDRLLTLHISDNDGADERHWMPGEGIIPWGEVVAALRDVRYGGPFLYEVKRGEAGLAARLAEIAANYGALVAAP